MLHRFFCIAALAVFTAVIFCGCSDRQVADPPLARAELTARLFDALQFQRYDDAMAIVDKLLALDPDDVELIEMRNRVIANACTTKVQKLIDQGKLDEALQIVSSERKKYPMLPQLMTLEEEVRGLIALRNAAGTLAAAKSIPELAAALENIAPLAAKYPQAEALHRDIALRRNELERLRAEANRNREAAAGSNSTPSVAPAVGR